MIYFDNSATTVPYPEALRTYQEVATKIFGNPSSLHQLGTSATQQRVAIRLPLHQQLLQTQHLAMRLLVAQQLVTPLLTKTCKRLGNPAFFL